MPCTQVPLKEENWGASLKLLTKPRSFSWSAFSLPLFCILTTSLFSHAWGFTPPPSEDVPKTFTLKGKEIAFKALTNPLKKDLKAIKQGGILYTER